VHRREARKRDESQVLRADGAAGRRLGADKRRTFVVGPRAGAHAGAVHPASGPVAAGRGEALPTSMQDGRRTAPAEKGLAVRIGAPGRGKWAVFGVVAVGVFMATLDSSIVNISLPAIASAFHHALAGLVEWVIIAYLVVIASLLITIGRLADIVGHKPIWLSGLVIFTTGSAICGASPSLEFLVGARALQGLGGALLMAISPAMLTGAFPSSERGRALGLNAVTVAVGVSAGPTLGGFITEHLTWRWIFYVNVPVGIVGFVAALAVLVWRRGSARGRFDPPGAVLLAGGLLALTLALSFGQEWGWISPGVVGLLAGALALFAAFVAVESRMPDPVVDLSLFRNRVFTSAGLSSLLSFLALFAVGFLLPVYLEELRGFSTEAAGILLTPLPVVLALVAPVSGTLADRVGTRWLAASGLTLGCLGLVLLAQLTARTSPLDIAWRLGVIGVGQGLFQSPNNSALMGAAPRDRQGIASGFLATLRVVGQSLSVAVAGAVFAAAGGTAAGAALVAREHGAHLSAGRVAALQQTFLNALHSAFVVCAIIAAIGIFASLVRGKQDRPQPAAIGTRHPDALGSP
jgi:EmrB/QacA subfamily drug resistance transporter